MILQGLAAKHALFIDVVSYPFILRSGQGAGEKSRLKLWHLQQSA